MLATLRRQRAYAATPANGADEIHNLFERSARLEYRRDALALQFGGIFIRNDAANHYHYVAHVLFPKQIHHARHDRVVRSGEDRQADDLDILLKRGVHDHFRRLPQARCR